MSSRYEPIADIVLAILDYGSDDAWLHLEAFVRPIAGQVCRREDEETQDEFPSWALHWLYNRRQSAIRNGTDRDTLSKLRAVLARALEIEAGGQDSSPEEAARKFMFVAMRDYALPDYFTERNKLRRRPDDEVVHKLWFEPKSMVGPGLQERIERAALLAHVQRRIATLPDKKRVAFRLRFFPLLHTLEEADVRFLRSKHAAVPPGERLFEPALAPDQLANEIRSLLKKESLQSENCYLSFSFLAQALNCRVNTVNANVLRTQRDLYAHMETLSDWREQ